MTHQDDAYEPGDPKRSDYRQPPPDIGPRETQVTYPVVRFPTSITHWTCPKAPIPGSTHHMGGTRNACRYCGRNGLELRREQEEILRVAKGFKP